MHRTACLLIALVVGCSTGPSDSTVPQLGRYTLRSQWSAGGAIANVDGTLTITAATASSITWSLIITEFSGTSTHSGVATTINPNEYFISGFSEARAGTWSMVFHLTRSGATYGCSGQAISTSQGVVQLNCTFTYLGL